MSATLIASGIWSAFSQQNQAEKEMLEKAQILAQEMDAVWTFFETNQHQFKTDENGNYELYCVIAAKSVSKFFTAETDYTIHYTNLTTRRASDAPDAFELEAMNAFEENKGLKEYYAMGENKEGEQVFRYTQPLFMGESCLECHGEPEGELDSFGYPKEGKHLGDIAGAVSITMPVELYMAGVRNSVTSDILVFGAALLISLTVIFSGVSRFVTRPIGKLEDMAERIEQGDLNVDAADIEGNDEIADLASRFNSMAAQLKRSRDNLESQVRERTEELALANAELKNQRAQLERANEVLRETNDYKSDFLAIMSHELRTPLTAILAFAEIWDKSNKDRDDGERESVEEIRENGQLLLNMVDNILEVGRSEAGKMQLLPEPIEMVDLVNAIEDRLSFLAQKRSIEFSTTVNPATPIIMADWDKLRRIIENLAVNAIKYTEPGGRVHIDVDDAGRRNGILIMVRDNGIGIKAESMSSIFEKYMQVDASSRRYREGSGLGLAVVNDLVQLHGGEITVESEHGAGSTFTVFIPAGNNVWGDDNEDFAG